MPIPRLHSLFHPIRRDATPGLVVQSQEVEEFDAASEFLKLRPCQIALVIESIKEGSSEHLNLLGYDAPVSASLRGLPFKVTVHKEDFANWCGEIGVSMDDLSRSTDRDLASLRQKLGVNWSIAADIVDWQEADGAGEDLSENQRKPWPVEIRRSGYSGIDIELTAPDGTNRTILIEVEKGNLVIRPYRDQERSDEPDLKLTLTSEGSAIENTSRKGYVFYAGSGSQETAIDGDVPEAFTDEASVLKI